MKANSSISVRPGSPSISKLVHSGVVTGMRRLASASICSKSRSSTGGGGSDMCLALQLYGEPDPTQRLGRDQAKADSDSEQARIVAVRFDADVFDHDAWLPERDRAGHPLANQLASTHRIRLEQEAPQAAAELLAHDPLAGLGQQDQADRLAHVVFVRRERQPARRVDARREAQPLTEEMPSGFDHDEPQPSYDRRTGTQMRKNGSHQNAMFSAMTSTISRTKAHRV